jgi:hypothetical protein
MRWLVDKLITYRATMTCAIAPSGSVLAGNVERLLFY